jgi:hypothetical protein
VSYVQASQDLSAARITNDHNLTPRDSTGRIVRLRTNVRRKLNGRGLVVGREETKEQL